MIEALGVVCFRASCSASVPLSNFPEICHSP
jgi:hypothetical protein